MTLTELRASKKVGVREIARLMQTSHSAVIRFENHGTSTVGTMESYARALGVDFQFVYQASLETRAEKERTLVKLT